MDPNSPINQQPPASPQSVQTTQPLTQSGLPPQSIASLTPSPKSGPKLGLIIGLVIVFLVLGAAGFYIYTIMSVGKSIEQASLAVSPNPTLSSPAPATSSAVATSSATVDLADPNLMDFDSPCMSFKYPKNWVLGPVQVANKHIITQGYDSYGYTDISNMERKFTNQNINTDSFVIRVICAPNTFGVDIPKLKDLAKSGSLLGLSPAQTLSDVKISDTTINTLPAVELTFPALKNKDGSQRSGVIEVGTLKNNTTFDMQLVWDQPAQGNLGLPGQKEFDSIVSSVQIKDYFQKQ